MRELIEKIEDKKIWPKDINIRDKDVETETRRGVNNSTDFRFTVMVIVPKLKRKSFRVKTQWLGSGARADKGEFIDLVRQKLSMYINGGQRAGTGLEDFNDGALTVIG